MGQEICFQFDFGTFLATIKDSEIAHFENRAKFIGLNFAIGTDIALVSVNLPPQQGRRKKIHQISLRNEVKA